MLPHSFLGVYKTEQEKIRLFANLDHRSATILLYHENSLNLEIGSINEAGIMFIGGFHVSDDEFHYTLLPGPRRGWTNETGYDVIIFHRWDDYTPINPEDWFVAPQE